MKNKTKGSMTLEAALAIPIVIFAVLAFVYLFKVLSLQVEIQHGLSESANEMSRYAYVYLQRNQSDKEKKFNEEVIETISGNLIIRNQMNYFFSDQEQFSKVLKGDLSYTRSKILEDNVTLDLIVDYKINIPVPLFNIRPIYALQRIKTRAFIGTNEILGQSEEEGKENQTDEYVYITEYGTVYHRDPECSHLYLTVQSCDFQDVSAKRNTSGGKYYPCEKCCKGSVTSGQVYITETGTCYHVDKNCSGLKRTIKKVLLSSVKNMRPCSTCGKSHEES